MIETIDLDNFEQKYSGMETEQSLLICQLISEIRSLRHELKDPNYLYCGSRIHRQAVISRNNQMNSMSEEYKKRLKEIEDNRNEDSIQQLTYIQELQKQIADLQKKEGEFSK